MLTENSSSSQTMKRFSCRSMLVVAGIALLIIGLYGWFAIKPILGTCIDSWPESISNPPVMPNAEQIEFGKSSYEPPEGNTGKLTQFQTNDSPDVVYTFYLSTLRKEGWIEDRKQQAGKTLVTLNYDYVAR
jgi:hypothetical protein